MERVVRRHDADLRHRRQHCSPGRVSDQAALHGLIQKVRDLGLTLLEVIHEDLDACDEGER